MSGLTAAVVAAVGLPLFTAPAAVADTAPVPPVTVKTASADALPTVQVNGVVWDQVVVGNTVYAVGKFTSARPAGSAAGANETARSNALAYDITTGVMKTSWAPSLNAQGLTVAASADGKIIFVGGEFTTVNGTTRNRVAALDAATGAVLTGFNANAAGRVRSLYVNGSTLYLGGNFTTVGGQARNRAAAVSTTTGALTPWAPDLDAEVYGVVAPAGSGKVILGGRFQFANGTEVRGLAALDSTTAATQPWEAYGVLPNYGPNSAIYSLNTDGSQVYGTAYDFFGPSPFEGTFAADIQSGHLNWVSGCKGDTYDAAPVDGILYSVAHAHNCATIGGNPEINPRSYQYAQATSTAPRADGATNAGGDYPQYRIPELYHWQPTLTAGTYTGQSQAGWTVTGNSSYVLVGGEFPRVNGVAQQGLVRFAVTALAPNKEGPQGYAQLKPSVVSLAPGAVKVNWTAAWDRDNRQLTYEVLRGASLGSATVVKTLTADSEWWARPGLSVTDTGAAPGSSQTYRIRVKDAFGNTQIGETTAVTVQSGTAEPSPYGDAVRADNPADYWRLGEAAGTNTSYDWVGASDLTVDASATRGTAGALPESNAATTFSGSAAVPATSTGTLVGPQTFSVEAWIKTTTTSGGKIVGFGNSTTEDSSGYDRHLYMTNDGRVVFGVYPNRVSTVTSTAALNDDRWHHLVGTLGPAGQALYVDGKRVARRTDTTGAQEYSGYWRVGGDNLNGWDAQPASNKFAGAIDEVAVYPTALSPERVTAHFTAGGGTVPTVVKPTDPYGASVYDAQPDSYWRLNETSGTTAKDATPNGADGALFGGTAFGAPGIVSTTGVALDGVDDQVSAGTPVSNPTVYSEELWFNTTTTRGGKLIGFGNLQSGNSNNYDRHVYMFDDGRLRFGTYTGQLNVIDSPLAYNDGKWHHMVATQGGDGMKLYVDGQVVGTNPQTGAENYTGFWKVGGDNHWGGASSNYFAGSIDEVAVYSSVLSPAQVTDHFTKGGGQAPPAANTPPTAAFTSTATGLSVAFDGSTSADTDGTVAGYSWNFGDGSPAATGATTTHAYAAAGTFSVTLTVTDDKGATGTTTKDVVVTAPPANKAPTAAFTSSVNGLAASFDGSGSTDQDGTVTGWAWDFGDGTTGTGATVSHPYAAGGTFAVKLTVTDNGGATAESTQQVTVTAPPSAFATDAFGRTTATGFGTADTGGAWTVAGGASNFSVSGGAGRMKVAAAGGQLTASLGDVAKTDVDVSTTVALDKAQTGSGTYVSVVGRKVGTAGDYRVKVRFLSTGAVSAQLVRLVGTTETALATTTVPGLTYTPGDTLRIRLQVSGTGTTALAAKVWRTADVEPAAWQLNATDTTAALQAAGSVGLVTYLSASSTNAPMTASFDDFVAGPRPAA